MFVTPAYAQAAGGAGGITSFIPLILIFAIMYFLGKVDYRKFYDVAYIFYGLNIGLLIFVLIAGRHALGARRWRFIWQIPAMTYCYGETSQSILNCCQNNDVINSSYLTLRFQILCNLLLVLS